MISVSYTPNVPWVGPLPRMPVTTRNITFLVGIPINLHLPLLLGKGDNPKHTSIKCVSCDPLLINLPLLTIFVKEHVAWSHLESPGEGPQKKPRGRFLENSYLPVGKILDDPTPTKVKREPLSRRICNFIYSGGHSSWEEHHKDNLSIYMCV